MDGDEEERSRTQQPSVASDDEEEAYLESYGELSLLLPGGPEAAEDSRDYSSSSDSEEYGYRDRRRNGDSETTSFQALPEDQPASKYESALKLEYSGFVQIEIPRMPVFRNNLMVASGRFDLLMIANVAEVYVFEYNPVTWVPYNKPSLIVNTRPSITTGSMVQGANWPMDPHGANFARLKHLRGREVLLLAGDNGLISFFYVQDLLSEVRLKNEQRAHNPGPDPLSVRSALRPFFTASTHSSVWGLDIEPEHDLLAISNNSHVVEVFCLGPLLDGEITDSTEMNKITSPRLEHNIPDVEFVEIEEEFKKKETFYLSCIAISGEVALWEFYYGDALRVHREKLDSVKTIATTTTNLYTNDNNDEDEEDDEFTNTNANNNIIIDDEESDDEDDLDGYGFNGTFDGQDAPHILGPSIHTDDDYNHTPSSYTSHPFENGIWWYKEDLRQDGWCIKNVREQDFKLVDSLFEATGNQWMNEDAIFKYFNKESESILKDYPHNPDTVIPGVRFSNYDIETKFAQALGHSALSTVTQDRHYTLPICQKRDLKKQKYLRDRKDDPKRLLHPPFNNRFFVCTTKRSLYLCRVEDLFCNAARGNVFSYESPSGSNEGHFDRLSILQVIPALSAVVAVSQVGVVSIFRLTRYRGVFCMRQEYCFPKAENSFSDIGSQIIAGLCISPMRKCGPTEVSEYGGNNDMEEKYEYQGRFRLSLIHLDNTITTYELSRPQSSGDQIEDLVL